MIKIGVIGLGLGYSLSHYLAYKGYDVTGLDIWPESFKKPRVDQDMAQFISLKKKHYEDHIRFTDNYEEIEDRERIIIFVSTPYEDGRLSIGNVLKSITSCSGITADFLVLSTLPIGGMKKIRLLFPNREIYYCPPMVKHDYFLQTFREPPSGWQLIGHNGGYDRNLLTFYRGIVDSLFTEIIPVEEEIVEVAKIFTNCLLANKIIAGNLLGEWLQDDTMARKATDIVTKDPRLGKGYLAPGGPAAGPCFPRDLLELEAASEGSKLSQYLKLLNRINDSKEYVK